MPRLGKFILLAAFLLANNNSVALGETAERHDALFYAITIGYEAMCEMLEAGRLEDGMPENIDRLTFEASASYNNKYGVSLFDALKTFENKQPNDFISVAASQLKVIDVEKRAKICWSTYIIVHSMLPHSERYIVASLLEQYNHLNSKCRGGNGNAKATDAACDAREQVGARLNHRNWCYGHEGEAMSQMRWHWCEPTSLRPGHNG